MSQNQHITHYQILTDADATVLGQRVEEAIHAGWQPFGSLTVAETAEGPSFAQAVVKYADWFR